MENILQIYICRLNLLINFSKLGMVLLEQRHCVGNCANCISREIGLKLSIEVPMRESEDNGDCCHVGNM